MDPSGQADVPAHPVEHVVSQAASGEILVTLAAAGAAGLEMHLLERRSLSLKGHQADVVVVPVSSDPSGAAGEGSASR